MDAENHRKPRKGDGRLGCEALAVFIACVLNQQPKEYLIMLPGSEWVLERLLELEREKLQREGDNRREHALTAFLRALNETEIYYGSLRDSDKDRDREEELSRLWVDVARELFVVDVELAKRCELKAKYWADPFGWTLQSLERAQISIHEMRSALHRLIDQEAQRNQGRQSRDPN